MRLLIITILFVFFVLFVSQCDRKETATSDTAEISFLTTDITKLECCIGDTDSGVIPIVVVLSQPLEIDVTVPLNISVGSATRNEDYTIIEDTLHFAAGNVNCSTSISIINDAEVEPDETITLSIVAFGRITPGTKMTSTITIVSDDKPKVGMVHCDRTFSRRSGSFLVGVILDRPSFETISLPYTVHGTASFSDHHDLADGFFTILPGDTIVQKNVTVVNDSAIDGFKTIVITMTIPSNVIADECLTDSITIAYDEIVRFQIMNEEVSGWKQTEYDSDFRVTEGNGLYTVINGGATPYIESGYRMAMRQVMQKGDKNRLELMSLSYTDNEKLDSLFAAKKMELDTSARALVEGYTSDNVAGDYISGILRQYIRFDKMYFELIVTMDGDTSGVQSMAKELVDWINAR